MPPIPFCNRGLQSGSGVLPDWTVVLGVKGAPCRNRYQRSSSRARYADIGAVPRRPSVHSPINLEPHRLREDDADGASIYERRFIAPLADGFDGGL